MLTVLFIVVCTECFTLPGDYGQQMSKCFSLSAFIFTLFRSCQGSLSPWKLSHSPWLFKPENYLLIFLFQSSLTCLSCKCNPSWRTLFLPWLQKYIHFTPCPLLLPYAIAPPFLAWTCRLATASIIHHLDSDQRNIKASQNVCNECLLWRSLYLYFTVYLLFFTNPCLKTIFQATWAPS